MGVAASIVKGTVLLDVRGHIRVFFCVGCFLMLLSASLGLRHNLNYINVHNLKRFSGTSYSYQHCYQS